jgi:hypothetical protein
MMHKRHACININLFRIKSRSVATNYLAKHANSKAATSRNQRFCLFLRLDNDINEAISPPSSLYAGQLFGDMIIAQKDEKKLSENAIIVWFRDFLGKCLENNCHV